MLDSGLRVTINVTDMAPMVRFSERLGRIAEQAGADIAAQIEAAMEDMRREMETPRPSPRIETKGPT